jgi:hypothetical protein
MAIREAVICGRPAALINSSMQRNNNALINQANHLQLSIDAKKSRYLRKTMGYAARVKV